MQSLRCDRPVLLVAGIGLIGLFVIFLFDPTHDYPRIINEFDIGAGIEKNVPIPLVSSGFMQLSNGLVGDPYLWVTSNVDGIVLVEYAKALLSDAQLGVPASLNFSTQGVTIVRNTGNKSLRARIVFTIAPTPEDLSKAKTWWYVIFGAAQTVVAAIMAIRQSPTGAKVRSDLTSLWQKIRKKCPKVPKNIELS